MRRWFLLCLLSHFPLVALAQKPEFAPGTYSLLKSHGDHPERCLEGDLSYGESEDDLVINFAEKINFVAIKQKKIEEKVPDGCHYTFETSYSDKKLVQITKVKNCELDGAVITETLWQDASGLHYQINEKKDKKNHTTTCDYKLSKGVQE